MSLGQKIEKYIDPTTLEIFKNCNSTGDWTGSVDNENLFHVWKSIVNDSDSKSHAIDESTLDSNILVSTKVS